MPRNPKLHELSHQFVHRNLFLHVALGIVSMSRRLDDLIRAEAEYASREHRRGPAPGQGEALFLYLMLGLLSFSHRAMAYLDAARNDGRARATRAVPELKRPPSGPYLRSLLG